MELQDDSLVYDFASRTITCPMSVEKYCYKICQNIWSELLSNISYEIGCDKLKDYLVFLKTNYNVAKPGQMDEIYGASVVSTTMVYLTEVQNMKLTRVLKMKITGNLN